ncbi:MAG: hypothetical protein MJD61_21285 [Proteobacteria bacterium]|nr:hypothetical protein [Pseudomonadota bacterium]
MRLPLGSAFARDAVARKAALVANLARVLAAPHLAPTAARIAAGLRAAVEAAVQEIRQEVASEAPMSGVAATCARVTHFEVVAAGVRGPGA